MITNKRDLIILTQCIKGSWQSIDDEIHVTGSVWLHSKNLTEIPIKFGKINGDFLCNHNRLTSLKNAPYHVTKNFYCYDNKLTSLDHMPRSVDGNIWCNNNPFILNDELFTKIAKHKPSVKFAQIGSLLTELYNKISPQFGITDKKVIDEIWESYMNQMQIEHKRHKNGQYSVNMPNYLKTLGKISV